MNNTTTKRRNMGKKTLAQNQGQVDLGEPKEVLVCERTGKLGAKRWPDTHLFLTEEAHTKFQRELGEFEAKFTGGDHFRQAAELILTGLAVDCGIDVEGDENFRDTPNRYARMMMELFGAQKNFNAKVDEILGTSFPGTYSNMVIIKDIAIQSLCPHHLATVSGKATVAYLPAKGGQVLGLSKISRLTKLVAARPALQEQVTEDIANLLYKKLAGCRGSAVHITAKHNCVGTRGVCDTQSVTVTSTQLGIFRNPREQARAEFLAALSHTGTD